MVYSLSKTGSIGKKVKFFSSLGFQKKMKAMLGMPGSGGNVRGYLFEKYYPGSVIVKGVEG